VSIVRFVSAIKSFGCEARDQKINHNAVVVVKDRPPFVIDWTCRSPPLRYAKRLCRCCGVSLVRRRVDGDRNYLPRRHAKRMPTQLSLVEKVRSRGLKIMGIFGHQQ
jgi:hypothetical protein